MSTATDTVHIDNRGDMPPRRQLTEAEREGAPPTVAESSSTALAMPDDLRRDLLRSQQEEITRAQNLPQIVIMGAGACLYEFPEDGNRTTAEFTGVILGSHDSNVLWTRPYGQVGLSDEEKLPDCSSIDGKFGTPKAGFRHAALANRPEASGGPVATGNERIECKYCPYNKFGTGNLFLSNRNPKGKAVTNNKRIYVAIEGSMVPYEMVLPPTSATPFEEYLTKLRREGIPVQSVVTKFTQVRMERNGQRYGVIKLENAGDLSPETFRGVLMMRTEFKDLIYPIQQIGDAAAPVVMSGAPPAAETPREPGEEDDDTPF